MADPEAPEEGFRVVDRRGKGPVAEPHSRQEAPPSAPPEEPAAVPAGAVASETPGSPDLASLFLMLASSAVIYLGEGADPVTGEVRKDLDQAQYSIDLLVLLRDKTEGHRTPEETQLLTGILHDLQMRFVRAINRR